MDKIIIRYVRQLDKHQVIYAYCKDLDCRHSMQLSGLDPDMLLDDIKPKLKCAKCGNRDCGWHYSHDINVV